ncbi:MAG: HIT domain-containing protein [Candidatus Cloacimonetes bacterium]|nr:HIT domain-containing protein [Candidatus Cloacimonadota bacterium]
MSGHLYSPWRLEYILSAKSDTCPFCLKEDGSTDEAHFVVYRTNLSFVILNLYPYNNGHIMVIPVRHTQDMDDLTDEEYTDLFGCVRKAERVLRAAYSPDGINIGMNLGKAAGAGIDSHLHVHLLPRWSSDSNFMTTVGGTRVIPEAFERTYHLLKNQFDSIEE